MPTHLILDQESCNETCSQLRNMEFMSHVIYIYAHGSDKKAHLDVLKKIDGSKFIFIDDLAKAVQEAMDAGKSVYLIANSCYWNLKYEWEFPTPTISFGSDQSTRLPFDSSFIENKLNSLPDEVSYSEMETCIRELEALFEKEKNIFECYVGDKLNEVRGYRVIKASPPPPPPTCMTLSPPMCMTVPSQPVCISP